MLVRDVERWCAIDTDPDRETAVTAFTAARASSPSPGRVRIHTGHWGTGAFGGDRVLMAAAQVLAGRAAGLDALAYHSLDDSGVAALRRGEAIAGTIPAGSSLEAAIDALHERGFTWGTSDGN